MEAVTTESATWLNLEDSPEWARLSTQQRAWLALFLASAGDSLAAAKGAYRVSSAENHRAIAHQVAHHPAVVAALDVANGTESETAEPTREELIASTRRQLRRADPGSVAASRLNAQLLSLASPEKSETPAAKEPKTVPADALEIWRDKTTGKVIGYRGADGTAVKL
jgi:hypothetical protein